MQEICGGDVPVAAALDSFRTRWIERLPFHGEVADGLTSEQRDLYGQAFETFAAALNGMQNGGLDSAAAARSN